MRREELEKKDDLPAVAGSRPPCEDKWEECLRKQKEEARATARLRVPDGFHSSRLAPKAHNPREVAFMDQWREEHESDDLLRILACLEPDDRPGVNGIYGFPPMKELRKINQIDRRNVSTVIQWLGSNIGMAFLEASLQRVGMRIVSASKARGFAPPQAETDAALVVNKDLA